MADRDAAILEELFADSDSDMESVSSSEESGENNPESDENSSDSSGVASTHVRGRGRTGPRAAGGGMNYF